MPKVLGYVLRGATTHRVRALLTEDGERVVREGMLVTVKSRSQLIVSRVDSLQYESQFFGESDLTASIVREGSVDVLAQTLGFYCVAELTLLGVASPRGLREVDVPPKPGDPVLDLEALSPEALFGVSKHDVVVWIDSLVGYENFSIPLKLDAMTMHVGIFGETGSGKSYTMGYILEKLSSIKVDGREAAFPTIVIDANGDYIDIFEHFQKFRRFGAYREVRRYVFESSHHRYQPHTYTIKLDLDELEPRELAELVIAYRFGNLESNELQLHLLSRALEIAREMGVSFNRLFLNPRLIDESLDRATRELDVHPQTLRAVRSAISKFRCDLVDRYRMISLGEEHKLDRSFVEDVTTEPLLVIMDFSADGSPGIPLIVKQLVVAFLAKLVFKTFTTYKIRGDQRHLLMVIEEAQNYVPNSRTYPVGFSVARDIVSLIATQGRKFGVCLAIVSQRPLFVDPVVLSMINTWFIHRVSPEDANYISRLCGGLPPSLEKRLVSLSRGMCIVVGQMNPLNVPLLVKIGKRTVSHRMGRADVLESLRRLARQ